MKILKQLNQVEVFTYEQKFLKTKKKINQQILNKSDKKTKSYPKKTNRQNDKIE